MEAFATSVSDETVIYVKGFGDVVAGCNLGIGFSLIISSSTRDCHSAEKVLLGELVWMSCLLIVAFFNTTNSDIVVDACPHPTFWIVLIANPSCVSMDCWKVRIYDQTNSKTFVPL